MSDAENFEEVNKSMRFQAIMDTAIVIFLHKKFKGKNVGALYTELGLKTFSTIMHFFAGEKVTFPTVEEWEDAIKGSVIFYYHEIEKKPWKEIATIVPGIGPKSAWEKKLNLVNAGIRQALAKCMADLMEGF